MKAKAEHCEEYFFSSPEQVRRSGKDAAIHLRYRKSHGHYYRVVVKYLTLNGDGCEHDAGPSGSYLFPRGWYANV